MFPNCAMGAGAGVAATGSGCVGATATGGFAAIGAAAIGGGGGCTTAGRSWAGGLAITGPTGGLLAIAGDGGGATIFAPCRGSGTMRRGRGACGVTAAAGGAATTTLGGAVAACAEAGGGVATTAVGRGGAALMAASACLRSRIAFRASPGFDTLERSNFGFDSTGCFVATLLRPPPLKYSRTLSAWSGSIELEWVFPVTPIASSASRMGLLFTSSSRAKSLIRTLLIRPPVDCALSCHISLIEVGIFVICIIPEIAVSALRE